MKKKLLPICAMALLSVGYSSVASASTGTMTKEEVAQVQQDTTKKEAAMQEQQKQDKMKKEAAVQEQQKQDQMKKEAVVQEQQKQDQMKKEAAMQEQQKQDKMKKEAAVQATKGEKLPNTASNSITMMTLSACLVALGSLFGFTRRKIKA
ncbi:LPXTG cell wall anchor domain-containing protein [Bacillus pseudomycoides]|uniref:LPXTG cell wall anchor domain-containing protein n=1 Tax=Bacillus pseudomycoides TaxID=64104 RepID=UPI000BED0BC9|nr:LPXTG cell wall anchor domain-containing protein [Bacillus pseudomycoides]MED4652148.1 LPXTG cell wall anchor domain-containing protein [Bacillus pseudomycoides]PEE05790.1 cell surface protein [Bacillus pseudomycoides]PEM71959.1 cell surface protein [Bacillus pseudomycoides]PHA94607.1 cell surface protein [Bacillus pseudomycoides]PHC80832.1 cell surface protein [Bacillus pseudomycoides]